MFYPISGRSCGGKSSFEAFFEEKRRNLQNTLRILDIYFIQSQDFLTSFFTGLLPNDYLGIAEGKSNKPYYKSFNTLGLYGGGLVSGIPRQEQQEEHKRSQLWRSGCINRKLRVQVIS